MLELVTMKETAEFRIDEELAKRYLDCEVGIRLGINGSVRKVQVSTADPLYRRIGEVQRECRAHEKWFFLGWSIRRHYSEGELEDALALRIKIKHVFEPTGEECGTHYDDSRACPHCGAGAPQVSDLILEARSLPKRGHLAIAKTIGGEVVVSAAFAEAFKKSGLTGAEFYPVRRQGKPSIAIDGWRQLIVRSNELLIAPATRVGIGLFDDDDKGEYRCSLSHANGPHVIGLNLISELSLTKVSYGGSDISCTRQLVGWKMGLLRPEPLLVVSPQFKKMADNEGFKGLEYEVVHLV